MDRQRYVFCILYLFLVYFVGDYSKAQAWTFVKSDDPLDQKPSVLYIWKEVETGFGVAGVAVRRWKGKDWADFVISFPDNAQFHRDHEFVFRVDRKHVHRFRSCSLQTDDREEYDNSYYSIIASEPYCRKDKLVFPVIFGISGRGEDEPNLFAANPPRRVGEFLDDVIEGNILYIRYKDMRGRYIDLHVDLAGITRPVNKVLQLDEVDRCEFAISREIMESGCFGEAIRAARQAKDFTEDEAESAAYQAVQRKCKAEMRPKLRECSDLE